LLTQPTPQQHCAGSSSQARAWGRCWQQAAEAAAALLHLHLLHLLLLRWMTAGAASSRVVALRWRLAAAHSSSSSSWGLWQVRCCMTSRSSLQQQQQHSQQHSLLAYLHQVRPLQLLMLAHSVPLLVLALTSRQQQQQQQKGQAS
jgi:hypothetical protein